MLGLLQAALAELIASVPQHIDKAADLERALGVRKTLAWQVYRMANAQNPLIEGAKLPGQFAMQRFFSAAAKAGVPDANVHAASNAFAEFRQLIRIHAGDRRTFESLVSGVTSSGVEKVELAARKAAFEANSHILGIQARTRISCQIFTPATASLLAHFVSIRGLSDLRWLRADDVPVLLASEKCLEWTEEEGEQSQYFLPIDRSAQKKFGGSLLPEYCSRPLEGIETITDADGSINTILRSREVGNASSRTYFVGSICAKPVSMYRGDKPTNDFGVVIRIPCQAVIHDLMIHESYVVREPTAEAYSDHDGGKAAFKMVRVPLLQNTTVSYLGNGAEALHTCDVPRYQEIVEDVAKRVGFELEQLRVYRCRIEYPFMPSSVVMYFEAPEKPESSDDH